jgi:hypothetical protein
MLIKREGEIACVVKLMVKYLVDCGYITVPFSCQKLSCGVQYIPVWLSWILNSFFKSLKHVRCKWANLLPCYIICMSPLIIILKNKADVLLTYFPLRILCMHIEVVVVVWYLDSQLPVQSMPIITKVVFELRSRRGLLDTTLCDKVCQWLATGRWFSPGTPVSSTNKTDRHNMTEILLKVALNSITLTF